MLATREAQRMRRFAANSKAAADEGLCHRRWNRYCIKAGVIAALLFSSATEEALAVLGDSHGLVGPRPSATCS
jgi:hypothetical protein